MIALAWMLDRSILKISLDIFLSSKINLITSVEFDKNFRIVAVISKKQAHNFVRYTDKFVFNIVLRTEVLLSCEKIRYLVIVGHVFYSQ